MRLLAKRHRLRAAELEMYANVVTATRSMKRLTEAFTASEVREIAEHPDLAELNAQMKGWYEHPNEEGSTDG
ncbi:hypothetical protein V2S66_31275 [Streptomyces sp. V4-01]|uniref:Uncharacterized protein n=1 Tax=Actinacidiphila polyblastidii TaxID=3110430 RepID=A0ABU7PL80_9ACTN|nr:hypothetical protein [Streptomyces sp. V4-01]